MSIVWLWDDTFVKFPSLPYCVLLCGCLRALLKSPLLSPRPGPRLHDNIVTTEGKGLPFPFQKLSLFKRRRCQTHASSQGSSPLTENARQSSSWRALKEQCACTERHWIRRFPFRDKRQRLQGSRLRFGRHSRVNDRRKRDQSLPFSAIFIVV